MEIYIGIDIAKHSFDLAIESKQKVQHFDNDAKGIQNCCKALQKLNPELIVMEPTGGYEAPLVAKLQAVGLPVAVAEWMSEAF